MSVVWGLPYLLIKVAVRDLTPATVVGARTAIGAIVLLPLALRQGPTAPLLRAWKPLLAYCVVEMAVPWWLLSDAERRLPSSLSGLLIATVPLIAVILAALTGHADRFDRRGVIGLLIGLAGVMVLLGFDVGTGDLGAVGMVGLVAVGYAIGPLVASRYLGHLPSLGLATVSLVAVALVYAPVAGVAAPGPHSARDGRRLGPPARAGVHGAGVRGVLRADQRDRLDPVHAHHLPQPGGGGDPRSRAAGRAVHPGHGHRVRPHPGRVLAVHRPCEVGAGAGQAAGRTPAGSPIGARPGADR